MTPTHSVRIIIEINFENIQNPPFKKGDYLSFDPHLEGTSAAHIYATPHRFP